MGIGRYHGGTMVPPYHIEGGGSGGLYSDRLWLTPSIEHPASSFEHQAPPKATLKPLQCDIKATPMRVDSQAVATPKPPQGSHKAPTKPP